MKNYILFIHFQSQFLKVFSLCETIKLIKMRAQYWTVCLLAIIWCLDEISASELLFPAPEGTNIKRFGLIAVILFACVVGGLLVFFLCRSLITLMLENCYPRAQMSWFTRRSYETI